MGWGSWTVSGCGRNDVWNYDTTDRVYYWTQRFGTHSFVRSGIFAAYGSWGYECGPLGPPVKDYGWVSELSTWGTWCEYGAVIWRSTGWTKVIGDYGQTTGRLATDSGPTPGAPQPPDHAELLKGARKRGPRITAEMRQAKTKAKR